MNVKALMQDYGLSIDDVRWYLAWTMSEQLLEHKEEPQALAHRIWSGKLEGELYDMEERFLRDLQDRLDRNLTDEHRVRELFREVHMARDRRHASR
jgi:hypothetical protein